MPVSLRVSIGIVSAVLVVTIAAITLSITITTSIDALRSIGKKHSESLLTNAQQQTTNLFDVPCVTADLFRNFTASTAWPAPSDNATVFSKWEELHRTAFMSAQYRLAAILTLFADNSRIGMQVWPDIGAYGGTSFIPAPYSRGGTPYQVTQPIGSRLNLWSVTDNAEMSSLGVNTSVQLQLATLQPTWNTLLSATFKATTTTMTGLYLVSSNRSLEDYVVVAVPLYVRGAKKGDLAQLYGITAATMYTKDIRLFLKNIGGTPNTFAAAMDLTGFLIATPTGTPDFETITQVTSTGSTPVGCASTAATEFNGNTVVYQSCRTPAASYPFAPLRAAMADANVLVPTTASYVTTLTVSGDLWYLAVTSVRIRYRGLGVQLVLLLPEADVIGNVVTGRDIAIGVTAAVVVVAALFGFALVSVLLSPLTSLADRMTLASQLKDDATARDESALSEIRDLQMAYYDLNDELQRIRSFVPQSVLIAINDGPDADLESDVERTGTDEVGSRASRKSARSSRKSTSDLESAYGGAAGAPATAGAVAVGVAARTVELGVSPQLITVVVLNVRNFNRMVDAGPHTTVSHMSELMTEVTTQLAANGGVLGAYHGDHITATFNAVRSCAAHARRGVAAAFHLTDVATYASKLQLRAGVSTGRCYVGNLGSAEAKAFHAVGPAFSQASILERLAVHHCREGKGTMATRRTCDDIGAHYLYKFVDLIRLPSTTKPALIAVITAPVPSKAEASNNRAGGADGEWLYVLGQAEVNDPHWKRNQAFRGLADGRLDAAVDPALLATDGAAADGLAELLQLRDAAAATESAANVKSLHRRLGWFYDSLIA